MKLEFLTQFFGRNKDAHEYAMHLIKVGRKDILLELNKAIKVIGSEQTHSILQKLSEKHGVLTPNEERKKDRVAFEKLVYSIHEYSEVANCAGRGKLDRLPEPNKVKCNL